MSKIVDFSRSLLELFLMILFSFLKLLLNCKFYFDFIYNNYLVIIIYIIFIFVRLIFCLCRTKAYLWFFVYNFNYFLLNSYGVSSVKPCLFIRLLVINQLFLIILHIRENLRRYTNLRQKSVPVLTWCYYGFVSSRIMINKL